ncbi:hypothetical protein FB45DRAFT_948176 [Roridomyces roridus]|uniref:Uncharacterized protein n=1 Tax=Roridomyces roridus TaxID=1738132 RepID=A0AAD7B1P7_9AGAR|nr:hypothetical protein FB45DRAFT_948176 [Roridomyces roridus]
MSQGLDIDYLSNHVHDANNIPPEPCAENPGRVYPRSDPRKAASRAPSSDYIRTPRYVGNPYLMHGAFKKLDHSLGELISILEGEEASSLLDEENPLLQKFKQWRDELDNIRATDGRSPASTSIAQLATPSRSRSPGRSRSPVRAGGLFVD